jgi:ribulose-phosphate 3-epimerase
MFTFHIETQEDSAPLIAKIKETKMKVGIAVKPKTAVESVFPYINSVDMVLIMTVEPGFGGQKMMVDCLDKVKVLRAMNKTLDIQVDGGIDVTNIEQAAMAGANVIVSGTGIFGHANPEEAIRTMGDIVAKHN